MPSKPKHTKKGLARLRRFLLVKEVIMLILVALSFVFLALEHFEVLSSEQLLAIETYEIVVAVIFLTEFTFELYFAKDRRKYWRTHWFYLIAAVPIPTESFELLKGIRALRLLKLMKIFAEYRYDRNTTLFESGH